MLPGPSAIASLSRYYEADMASGWGAADVIQQAAQYVEEHFGVPSFLPPPLDGQRQVFDCLMAVAEAIRAE